MSDNSRHGRPRARSRNLAEQLEATLSERIRDGVYAPGQRLPTESEIAGQEGVSRTVVREAISRLRASGLTETRHGIGTFVTDAPPLILTIDPITAGTVRDVLAMLELRITLEVDAAGLAAARRTDTHVEKMRVSLEAFEACHKASSDTVGADFDFHLAIAEATNNRYFVEIMTLLGTATIPRNRLTGVTRDARYLRTIHRQHLSVFQAIRNRDPESARLMMRAHLTASLERLRRAVEDADRPVLSSVAASASHP
jgi:DNA-binding FadR family transcriptional regulator